MIILKTFRFNMLQENTYVLHCPSSLQAVVIDCGACYPEERQAIVAYLRDHHLQLVHVLCTHGHLDHLFGNDTLQAEFGLKPEVHAADEFLATDLVGQARDMFGIDYPFPKPPLGRLLSDGDTITFGDNQLRVLHTPGHSPGGVTFYCAEERMAFTGDTLFRMSVGRTDLAQGSWPQLMTSLHDVLAQLPPDTTVYPGHGSPTTIGDELRVNPYMK